MINSAYEYPYNMATVLFRLLCISTILVQYWLLKSACYAMPTKNQLIEAVVLNSFMPKLGFYRLS